MEALPPLRQRASPLPLYQRGIEGDFINTDAEQDSRIRCGCWIFTIVCKIPPYAVFLQLLDLFDRPMSAQ